MIVRNGDNTTRADILTGVFALPVITPTHRVVEYPINTVPVNIFKQDCITKFSPQSMLTQQSHARILLCIVYNYT